MEGNDNITFKSILIRALYDSFNYFGDEELKNAVREYINIQYYGVTQLGSDNPAAPVNYGRNWVGPYAASTAHAHL